MLPSSQIKSEEKSAKKVLLVDDSSTVLMIHSHILGEAGYTCETAENGFLALEQLVANKFEAVLMDVNMPRMNGYELAKKIRDMEGTEELPIIMISTEQETQDRLKGIEAGANVYLTKPVNPEALVSCLKMMLNKAS